MNKKLLMIAMLSFMVFSCNKPETKDESAQKTEIADISQYESFGEKISPENAVSADEMLAKYEAMAVGDSVEIAFKGTVNSVCQSKGCWMKLDLGKPENETFVRFKDYGFFVPMDSEGAEAIIQGMAYKKETPIEELKHYAKDAGKSEEEIAAITEPKLEYSFLANGVLMKKKS